MERVLTAPVPAASEHSASSRVVDLTPALERTQRTWVSAVLVLEIADFARKSVSEQLLAKDRINALIGDAIDGIPAADRIVLETADGVAIDFLGAPAQALCAAVQIAAAAAQETQDSVAAPVRAGINFGPVRLAPDSEGQPNIIGDGVSVAQRIANFAEPGQVLVSRAYYETVTSGAEARTALFSFRGPRTDKHVREHEIYACTASADQLCEVLASEAIASGRDGSRPARGWLHKRNAALASAAASVLVFLLAAFLLVGERASTPPARVRTVPAEIKPAPVATAQPTDPIPAPEAIAAVEPAASAPTTAPASAAPAASSAEPTLPSAAKTAPRAARAKPARPTSAPPVTQTAAATSAPSEPVWLQPEPTPEPSETHADPVPAQKAPSGPTALVILAISPWGEVLLDGKPVGVSPPLNELEVTPGRHVIEVRNASFKPFQEDLNLGPNETIKIKHKFIQR
jgi:class 3 adenylate cyclase